MVCIPQIVKSGLELRQFSYNVCLYSATLWSKIASSRKAFVIILHWENDRIFLTKCLFEKF